MIMGNPRWLVVNVYHSTKEYHTSLLLTLQVEVVEGGVVTRLLTLVEQVELVVAQLVSMVVHLLQTVVAHVAPLVPVELEVLAPTLGLRGLR